MIKILPQELKKIEFLDRIKDLAEDIINEDRFTDAYALCNDLLKALDSAKNFKAQNREMYVQYRDIIYRLRWVSLHILTMERIIGMFKDHFVEIFSLPNYDIWQKLRIALLDILILKERDEFKKQLKEALLKNEEVITDGKITISNKEEGPTIANWLRDYNIYLGTGKVDRVKRAQFLTNSINVKSLSADHKMRLRTLFDIYERLKLSSFTLEGLEEEIPIDDEGHEGIIKKGVFEPLPKMTDKQKLVWDIAGEMAKIHDVNDLNHKSISLQDLRKMAENYAADSLERRVIDEEVKKLESKDVEKQ